MTYDEREQERKHKMAKDYWRVAFYVYCVEQQKKMDQASLANLESMIQFILDPKDKDKDKIEAAQRILATAEQTHQSIKQVEDLRAKTREKLDDAVQKDPDKFPDIVRSNIFNACNAFVQEQDKTKLATYATCILEHLDAMHADPVLAAKVNLSDSQMTLAAQIITVGLIIEEGMKCLEMEMNDALSPQHEITEEQHLMNITKIAAMEAVDRKRVNGNMLKELQECDMLKTLSKEDRFEFAAKMANEEKRRSMSIALFKSVDKDLTQPKTPSVGLK